MEQCLKPPFSRPLKKVSAQPNELIEYIHELPRLIPLAHPVLFGKAGRFVYGRGTGIMMNSPPLMGGDKGEGEGFQDPLTPALSREGERVFLSSITADEVGVVAPNEQRQFTEGKIPLYPPFPKGEDLNSLLCKRRDGEDLKNLFLPLITQSTAGVGGPQ